MTEVLCLFGDV